MDGDSSSNPNLCWCPECSWHLCELWLWFIGSKSFWKVRHLCYIIFHWFHDLMVSMSTVKPEAFLKRTILEQGLQFLLRTWNTEGKLLPAFLEAFTLFLIKVRVFLLYSYKRKTWKGNMIKNKLTRRKESDTYQATGSRHCWRWQIRVKIDKM